MRFARRSTGTARSRTDAVDTRLSTTLAVVTTTLLLAFGSPGRAAEIGTVLGATSDGSGNLIDITYDVEGSSQTLPADDLIGSTLVLSTLTAGPGDANRFWTLDGAPEPTEGQALRSVGDKYMGTALQDCVSTSQHDTLFDVPIIPGPGPEIFIYHGGLNDPFVVLDADGAPALTIANTIGNPISVALSNQFRAWYLRDNVNYQVQGTFPHVDTQSHIVALDLDALDVAAIGGLRFAGGPCDYVYEILGRQPTADPLVPFAGPQPIGGATSGGQAVAADLDGDGDLDTLITPGLGAAAPEMIWLENNGEPAFTWLVREIAATDARSAAAAADLDGDGDVDLIAASATDVAWFENDGASPPGWIERGVTTGEDLVGSLEVADFRGDGDVDLLVTTGGIDGEVLWFENDGASPPGWTRQSALTASDLADAEAADLDRDGDLDLVVAGGATAGSVQTIRNDGDGSLWTPLTAVSTPNPVRSLAVGDVDGDGDLDAAAATPDVGGFGSATLLWLDNDGGGLWSLNDVDGPDAPQAVELLDLNLDGDVDLLFGTDDAGAGSVGWLSNDTALGDFGDMRTIASGATTSIVAGDLDGDGDVDVLASADPAAWVENRTIHRSGIYPTKSVITNTADAVVSVYSTDVDGDGDIDVLSASQVDDTIAWYENDGTSPPTWTKRIIANDTDNAFYVSAGDMDGDGDIDALSASQPEDLIAWYENNSGSIALDVINPDFELLYKSGSTTVTAPVFPVLQFAFGPSSIGMTGSFTATFSDGSTGSLFDMPGWQWSEVLGVTNVNPLVTPGRDMVLLINGAAFGGGTAGRSVTQVLSESLEQDTVYTLGADFGWRTDNSVASLPPVLELRAGGTLLTPIESSSPALIQGEWVTYSRSYVVSDPGISGPLEIEVGLGPNTNAQQLNIDRVTLRKKNSTTPSDWIKRTISDTVDAAISAVPVDLDGDGDLDALTAANLGDTIAWYENDGASPPNWTENIISTTAVLARNAIAADVDGDGDMDVLSASDGDDTIAWYENPTWTKRIITNTANRAIGVFATDMDGDGDVDALSASIDDDTIAWYENDGDVPPNWTQRIITNTADGAYSVVAADLDADGDIDALSSSLNDDTIAWYENDGDVPPNWIKRVITDTAEKARAVFAADLDGDGDLDALSASEDDDTVAWYENRGGQFANPGALCFGGTLVEGEEVPLISKTVALNARPGDSVGLFVSFEASLGLLPSQLSSVLDRLRVWRDDGSGAFEPEADLLIGSYRVAAFPPNGAVYTIPLPAADPASIVAGPATYILTGVVRADASASGFPSLTVVNGTPGLPVLHDATARELAGQVIPLSQEAPPGSSCIESMPIERVILVDDAADDVDTNPGDGVCATAGAACTLRAAITEANASPGPDRIALPAGTYTLTLVADDNTNAGGDLDINDDLTLVGAGADVTVIDGALVGNRVLNTNGAVTVSISDLTVRNGDTNGPGGGLFVAAGGTVELLRCVLEANTALTTGGGISADTGTFVQVVDSRIVDNVAESGAGGGVYGLGTVSIVWSELSANRADGGGGGIYGNSVLQVLGSTISGNSAVGSFGGGIYVDGTAFVALDNTTLAANDAAGAGGGVLVNPGATFNSNNNIIAGNVPSDCTGDLLSGGYTLLADTGGCNVTSFEPGTDLLGVDPLLAPLGDNGGSTLTHRLQIGSPAIDAGRCAGPSADRDQTGEARPIDDPFIPNADDGCDVGAVEATLGQSLPTIEVPIRWCGLRGAPSIDDPSLVGQATANDVMRRRHEIASDEVYSPRAGIVFRSGGNFIVEDYPILDDADCVETTPGVFDCDAGLHGDVVLDLAAGDFSEFQNLVAACRSAWQALDPDIQGITAITINKFVDPDGNELDIRGVGGRAPLGDAAEQFVAGRVMLIDPFYRGDFPGNPNPPNPVDEIERLLGHEIGHALSLDHGNGVDDDADTLLDNNDEQAVGLPRFDGPNLLQYRNGDELTVAQAQQMRLHILLTLPDGQFQPFSDSIANGSSIDEEQKKVLGFGYDAVTELEQKKVLGFEQKKTLGFEQKKVLGFEQKKTLGFEQKKTLSFDNASVLEFGMGYTGTTEVDDTTVHVSLRDLPWYAPIRPDTRYFVYLDLDTDDATGGYPADFPNPSEPGFNFPGSNDFVDEPLVGEELGVDLILQTTLTSTCPSLECESFSVLEVFEFNGSGYDLVATENEPDLTAYNLGLYIENGGTEPEFDDVPSGFTIRPTLPNQLLFDNGWDFGSGPNGPVPNPVGIEVLVEIDCDGTVLNDDPSSAPVDCQCLDCNDCSDYPGCDGTTGVPRTLADTRITSDRESGELTFQPPLLPEAVVAPTLASEGQTVTVYVYDLPTDVVGGVEVTLDDVVLATVPTSAIDADGNVALSVPLPIGALGDQRLSAGITGFAPRATAVVTVTPLVDFPDNDGDGTPDSSDPDDDNDGVTDVDETAGGSDPLSPLSCGDADADSCDDCSRGDDGFGPLPDADIDDDGPDFDLDGQCDAGDADDDGDGVDDTIDLEPFNPDACGDTDNDWCDDCLVVSDTPSPLNDGPDFDEDGICDFSDPNQPPVAVCANALVMADAQCQASADIDDGSFDPDAFGVTTSQSPAGPYPLGDTVVTLTVTDPHGGSATCPATVTVADATAPVITACAADRTLVAGELDGTAELADLTFEVAASDACGPVTVTQDPIVGSLLTAGSHDVTFNATDGVGNFTMCVAEVVVLDRLLSTDEKIKVRFDMSQDGSVMDDQDDDQPPVLDTPHCFTRLDLDGNLQLRDSTRLPADVRLPGNTVVDARLVVSLSGQVVSDETLVLDVASVDDEKWEYKRAPGTPKEGVKRLKFDWNETASYDSHQGTGLGDDVPQITTRFVGFDETDAELEFKRVSRPFQVRFEDPIGGTVLIDVVDASGNTTITPAGSYDTKSKKDKLTLVLPFRLTPDTTIAFTADGGQTEIEIPVDTEFNYQPAGAKYKLDLDETTLATTLCTDPTTPVNSLTSPELEVQLFLGDGLAEVVGVIAVGPNPADWTRVDERQWRVQP